MAGDTFAERMDLLSEIVGKGVLTAAIEVDQVYARYQTGWGDPDAPPGSVVTPTAQSHGPKGKPGPAFSHPHGGRAGYLSQTLTALGPSVAQAWADSIAEERPLATTTIVEAERVAAYVSIAAPVEVGILRGSGAVTVTDEGATIYDRPPVVPRLTQEAIDAAHGRR